MAVSSHQVSSSLSVVPEASVSVMDASQDVNKYLVTTFTLHSLLPPSGSLMHCCSRIFAVFCVFSVMCAQTHMHACVHMGLMVQYIYLFNDVINKILHSN